MLSDHQTVKMVLSCHVTVILWGACVNTLLVLIWLGKGSRLMSL